MQLDLTVTLGDIVTLAAVVVSAYTIVWRLSYRIGALETKVDAMWHDFMQRRRRDDPRS